MKYFIDQLRILLPVLGVDIFRGREPSSVTPTVSTAHTYTPPVTDSDSPVFHLKRLKLGIDALAQIIDGEFTMLEGSVIVPEMRESKNSHSSTSQRAYESRKATLEKLIQEGSVSQQDGQGVLVRDVVFTSPSAAGAVALGRRSLNGRTEWITADGRTFDDWETSTVNTP